MVANLTDWKFLGAAYLRNGPEIIYLTFPQQDPGYTNGTISASTTVAIEKRRQGGTVGGFPRLQTIITRFDHIEKNLRAPPRQRGHMPEGP